MSSLKQKLHNSAYAFYTNTEHNYVDITTEFSRPFSLQFTTQLLYTVPLI